MFPLKRAHLAVYCLAGIIFLSGCQSIPKDVLQLPTDYMDRRKLQTRQYETTDREKMVSAGMGVLQDLGFNIDEGESRLGVIFASKDRDAKDAGQLTAATVATAASILLMAPVNYYQYADKEQKMRACVVVKPTGDGKGNQARVSFQRLVWNMGGDLSRIETIKDPKLYQGFFEKLSKSVFLEGQEI